MKERKREEDQESAGGQLYSAMVRKEKGGKPEDEKARERDRYNRERKDKEIQRFFGCFAWLLICTKGQSRVRDNEQKRWNMRYAEENAKWMKKNMGKSMNK